MKNIFFACTLVLLAALNATAQSEKSLLFYPLENKASLTDAEAKRVNDVLQNRLRTIKGWKLVDSSAIQGMPATCDQECQINLAQKLQADLLISGNIETTEDAGIVVVQAMMLDAEKWKELQRESVTIGPDIEKDLGKISGLAKMFDPASTHTTSQVEESPEDRTSTAANWVLGGGALAVLAIVLYSLL